MSKKSNQSLCYLYATQLKYSSKKKKPYTWSVLKELHKCSIIHPRFRYTSFGASAAGLETQTLPHIDRHNLAHAFPSSEYSSCAL